MKKLIFTLLLLVAGIFNGYTQEVRSMTFTYFSQEKNIIPSKDYTVGTYVEGNEYWMKVRNKYLSLDLVLIEGFKMGYDYIECKSIEGSKFFSLRVYDDGHMLIFNDNKYYTFWGLVE